MLLLALCWDVAPKIYAKEVLTAYVYENAIIFSLLMKQMIWELNKYWLENTYINIWKMKNFQTQFGNIARRENITYVCTYRSEKNE